MRSWGKYMGTWGKNIYASILLLSTIGSLIIFVSMLLGTVDGVLGTLFIAATAAAWVYAKSIDWNNW